MLVKKKEIVRKCLRLHRFPCRCCYWQRTEDLHPADCESRESWSHLEQLPALLGLRAGVRACVPVRVRVHMASPAADIWRRWEKWRGSCGALMVSAKRILLQAQRGAQVFNLQCAKFHISASGGIMVKNLRKKKRAYH